MERNKFILDTLYLVLRVLMNVLAPVEVVLGWVVVVGAVIVG